MLYPAKVKQKKIQPIAPRILHNLVKKKAQTLAHNIHCGLQDKAGNLWFGSTGDGIYRYDGKSFVNFTTKDGLSSNGIMSMLEDKAGNLWFGTTDDVFRYDSAAQKSGGKAMVSFPINLGVSFTLSNNTYYTDKYIQNTVWSIYQDRRGKVWFGTGAGVFWYDGKTVKRFLQNDGIVNSQGLQLRMVDWMHEDINGFMWFASGMPPGMEGVCRFDGKSISSFKPNGDSWVRYIVEDKTGKLWFGGRSHGNFYYDPASMLEADGKAFTMFTDKVGVGNPILTDISGNIWFTGEELPNSSESREGIWRYNPSKIPKSAEKQFVNFSVKDGMGKYFVHCMINDREGNIWIGTRNTGLYKYNPSITLKEGEKRFTCYSEE